MRVGEEGFLSFSSALLLLLTPIQHIINLQDLLHILLSARMMLISRPVGIKLMANLPVSLLLISLPNKRMLQQFRPAEPLTGRLVQQAL